MAKQNSSAAERQVELRRNYLQAIENRQSDLADTKNDDEVFAVLANISAARDALLKSVSAGLSANGEQIEKAYKSLAQANQAVEQARKGAEKLAALFKKLSAATTAATDLAKALAKAKKG